MLPDTSVTNLNSLGFICGIPNSGSCSVLFRKIVFSPSNPKIKY